MKVKRLIVLMLLAIMMLSTFACCGGEEEPTPTPSPTPTPTPLITPTPTPTPTDTGQPAPTPPSPYVEYTEVKVLEPQPRGAPDPAFRPDPPIKEAKAWHAMWSLEYADICEIAPGEEKVFDIQLTSPTVVAVKVRSSGVEPSKLSMHLYQEGQEQAVWSETCVVLAEYVGLISEEIGISDEMIAAGENWAIRLSNSGSQTATAEVLIGTVNPIQE